MRVVISGDKSRYHFFRSIVEINKSKNEEVFFTEKLGEKEVFLRPDLKKIGENVFFSSKIPLNTELYFPPEYVDLMEAIHSEDKVILFDEFPYATDSDIEQLNDILQIGIVNQISVVLFKNDRNTLETDISTEDMALDDAEQCYKNKNVTVFRYSIKDIPFFLLWNNIAVNNVPQDAYHAKLRLAKSELEIFDSFYDFMLNCSDEQGQCLSNLIDFDVLARFCEYDCKIEGNNVWEIYHDKAFQYYWGNNHNIEKFCKRIYKSAIDDICVWDFEKDFNKLDEEIKINFNDLVKTFTPVRFKDTKENYDIFLNINQSAVLKFKIQIQKFFTSKMRDIIKNRAQRNIQRMEALMR